jgi:NAD(P)-dependent dehydrogenase (short-subunit alcohol dehydrogenase family)
MVEVALVTGAGQGLGYYTAQALAKQGCQVIMTSRSIEHLNGERNLTPFKLDVTNDKEVTACSNWIRKTFGKLDILINNAAVYLERDLEHRTPTDFLHTLNTNLLGAYRVTEAMLPLMIKNKRGRIVNVSSGMGRFMEIEQESLFYSISKLGLNAYTMALHKKLSAFPNILINAVCPGWVKTRMGTEAAVRSIEEGAQGIIWAATLPEEGPSGQFFRDGTPLDWITK